jgi:hypothetical protein
MIAVKFDIGRLGKLGRARRIPLALDPTKTSNYAIHTAIYFPRTPKDREQAFRAGIMGETA